MMARHDGPAWLITCNRLARECWLAPAGRGARGTEPEAYNRAAGRPGAGGDLAVLGLGQPADDEQADADAAEPAPVTRLTLDEPVEDALVVAGRDADALVLDGDLDPSPRRSRRPARSPVPPSGEYLKAFSSSWPTMMSVAIVSPLAAAGRRGSRRPPRACPTAAGTPPPRRAAPRPGRTGRWSPAAGRRRPARRAAAARPACRATGPLGDGAHRGSPLGVRDWSHRLASVLANPCTTVIGVRSSWLVVARNRSLASSSSLAAVTSRKSTPARPRRPSEVDRMSIQRPLGSLWVRRARLGQRERRRRRPRPCRPAGR